MLSYYQTDGMFEGSDVVMEFRQETLEYVRFSYSKVRIALARFNLSIVRTNKYYMVQSKKFESLIDIISEYHLDIKRCLK